MVHLFKNLRPFQNYNFKIQQEINFQIFFNIDQNFSTKKINIEIWTFSFQIGFWNKFLNSGSGQTENKQASCPPPSAYPEYPTLPLIPAPPDMKFGTNFTVINLLENNFTPKNVLNCGAIC